MSFKLKFIELCKEHNVAFDVDEGRNVRFYAMSYPNGTPRLDESVTLTYDPRPECCEFVVDKIE